MQPRVSVLIATFNRAHYLPEALKAMLHQTSPPDEVIVIDDGSTDDTSSVIAQFAPAVKYLRKENGGKSSALNVGLTVASGDYIWVFDDDDIPLPDALERQRAVLDQDPSIGFTYSNHAWGITDTAGNIVRHEPHRLEELGDRDLFLRLLIYCYFMLGGVLARRDCYARVGCFREDLMRSQDYDMLIRLARGFRARLVAGGPTYILRKHSGMRGPIGSRHPPHLVEERWQQYDRLIGISLRTSLALSEYLLDHASEQLTTGETREAFLRRALVMASKGLLAEMIDDLRSGCDVRVNRQWADRLTDSERSIVYAFLAHSRYRAAARKTAGHVAALRRLNASRIGRLILRCFLRSCYWQVQDAAADERAWLLKFAMSLAPFAIVPSLSRAGDAIDRAAN